jgi:UDP:flavonoid glycosyltransferase YjiC (YdhE family)
MAKVLLAWELGADYGHVMRFSTLSRELVRRGHEAVLVLKDLTHAEALLADQGLTVLQAPVWQGSVTGLVQPASFAETLLRLGFLHPNALTGLCRAWLALFGLCKPDVLVCDYAPTALLATRGLGLPRICMGDGFAVPPRTQPMPIYRPWRPEPPARVAQAEQHTLNGANAALANLGQPPLRCLSELLEVDDEIIASFAEFDHYPGRQGARYAGPLPNPAQGVAPDWPLVDGPRVFAYLKPGTRDFEPVLKALRALDVAAVVHAPGVSTSLQHRYLAANIRFSEKPLRMDDICRECDIGICHAGTGTVQPLVTAGKPVLLLPQHVEQMMTARAVQSLGAGLVVDYERPAPDHRKLINRLIEEPAFAGAARAVAARYAGDDPAARLQAIVDRIEAVISAPRSAPLPAT